MGRGCFVLKESLQNQYIYFQNLKIQKDNNIHLYFQGHKNISI